MSIAVCDDDTKIQSIVQEYICKYSMEKDMDIKVDCYDTGEELCNQYQRGKYDLIFLDIEFTGRSGVEVGSFIRDRVQDEKVQIAYISGKTKYALELFEYHPINFLIKPFTEADVQKIIDKFILIDNQDEDNFEFKVRGQSYKLKLSEIMYFSSCGRKTTIHTKTESIEFYDSLDRIYSCIKNNKFLYVHKSYIVNYCYIKKMEYQQLRLLDETVIPISKTRRTEIRKMFMDIKIGEK